MIDLGYTRRGDPVAMNKYVFDCDIPILIGHGMPQKFHYGDGMGTNPIMMMQAFHPFHGFSMMSCGHIAEMNTSAIYIVGAEEPGYARGMGLKTRETN